MFYNFTGALGHHLTHNGNKEGIERLQVGFEHYKSSGKFGECNSS